VGDAGGQQAILAVRNLEVVYGAGIVVIRRVSLTVPSGSVVALLGANGAGKTTLLRAISGLLPMHRGHIVTGTIEFAGERVERMSAPEIVRRGMAQVLEGRRIFAELTVDENLRAGAFTRRDRGQVRETYDSVMTMFPVLAQRRTSTAGYLSGGEQQMLAIGRALMARPRLLLLDEPSLGLSPLLVKTIFDTIAEINKQGVSVLLVEQNVYQSLRIANRGYVLETGKIALSGSGQELLGNAQVKAAFLGA
jgi:branched-chain amino acid transport system ATP-binding protein